MRQQRHERKASVLNAHVGRAVRRAGHLRSAAPRPQPDPEIENDTIGRLFGENGVARTLDVTATWHTPFPVPQNQLCVIKYFSWKTMQLPTSSAPEPVESSIGSAAFAATSTAPV